MQTKNPTNKRKRFLLEPPFIEDSMIPVPIARLLASLVETDEHELLKIITDALILHVGWNPTNTKRNEAIANRAIDYYRNTIINGVEYDGLPVAVKPSAVHKPSPDPRTKKGGHARWWIRSVNSYTTPVVNGYDILGDYLKPKDTFDLKDGSFFIVSINRYPTLLKIQPTPTTCPLALPNGTSLDVAGEVVATGWGKVGEYLSGTNIPHVQKGS